MRKRVEEKFSGDMIEGFLYCLNQNLDTLRKEGIVFQQVDQISISPKGVIEYGYISKDVLKNAVIRIPQKGKKKLIKAILIAAYEKDWLTEYQKYYSQEGELLSDLGISMDTDKTNLDNPIKTKRLQGWDAVSDHSNPHWASFFQIPIENGHIRKVKCQLKTTSEYYRFGFKLLQLTGILFGETGIRSMDDNFLVHIGKNFHSTELVINAFKNGIPLRFRGNNKVKVINNKNIVELLIDNENWLHFKLNEAEVFTCLIENGIRKQIFMLSWGDGNDFNIRIENVEIEYII